MPIEVAEGPHIPHASHQSERVPSRRSEERDWLAFLCAPLCGHWGMSLIPSASRKQTSESHCDEISPSLHVREETSHGTTYRSGREQLTRSVREKPARRARAWGGLTM